MLDWISRLSSPLFSYQIPWSQSPLVVIYHYYPGLDSQITRINLNFAQFLLGHQTPINWRAPCRLSSHSASPGRRADCRSRGRRWGSATGTAAPSSSPGPGCTSPWPPGWFSPGDPPSCQTTPTRVCSNIAWEKCARAGGTRCDFSPGCLEMWERGNRLGLLGRETSSSDCGSV